MKISWVKSKLDTNSFRFFDSLGMNVVKVEDLENTDDVLEKLIDENCRTIVVSEEVASFSQNIMTKYEKEDTVRIIISPSNRI